MISDIDECREDSSRCANGACRNIPGSYICTCNAGYKRTTDGKSCEGVYFGVLLGTRAWAYRRAKLITFDCFAADLSRGLCFSQVDNGICRGSTKMMMMVTKSDCCCTAGVAWGSQCVLCPRQETGTKHTL